MHEMSLAEGLSRSSRTLPGRKDSVRSRPYSWKSAGCRRSSPEAMAFVLMRCRAAPSLKARRSKIIDVPGEGPMPFLRQTVAINAVFDPCPECGNYRCSRPRAPK